MCKIPPVANHFACLGFPIKSQPGFMKLLERALRLGEDAEEYVLWKPCESNGIELWLPMVEDDCMGCNVHYRGTGRTGVVVVRSDLDEAGNCTLGVTLGDQEIEVAIPNAEGDTLEVGQAKEMQLTLFAGTLVTTSAAIVSASASASGAAVSTTPAFARVEQNTQIRGLITLAEVLENTDTENPFVHCLLSTALGTVDIVAEAEVALPLVGSEILATGWLSGRLA
jgi:hypothetical protein